LPRCAGGTSGRARESDVAALRAALSDAAQSLALLRQPGLQLIALKETPDAPPAAGHVLVSAASGRALRYAFDPQAVPRDKTYELWWITGRAGPVRAGIFQPDERGVGRIEAEIPPDAGPIQAAAVTVEPAGGMSKPSGTDGAARQCELSSGNEGPHRASRGQNLSAKGIRVDRDHPPPLHFRSPYHERLRYQRGASFRCHARLLPRAREAKLEPMITNQQSGTNIEEIAAGIYRINTPVTIPVDPGRFSFNQYLIVDDEPLLFHTGPRRMFALVSEAVGRVMPVERLRYVAYSHFEADECGAMNEWLAAAPAAEPLCSAISAMTSANDVADRPARAMADGEELSLGTHRLRWHDTPHVPHGWDAGLLMETATRTLLCGDLFTQGGPGDVALTDADILGPSEAFRAPLDYFAHAPHSGAILERLAAEQPTTLACMHGSAWRGDGAALLRALADRIRA
jgi:hypothetical protein